MKRAGRPTGWRHRRKPPVRHSSSARPVRRNPTVIRLLVIGYGVFWAALAIEPKHRADWLLENLLVFAFAGFLFLTRKTIPFSTVSYCLMTAFLALHAVGAHYTYSETPIGYWIQDWLSQDRNHYDRFIHFGFGLLMFYPVRELVTLTTRVRGAAASIFAYCGIVFFSTVYEILEWVTAQIVSPETAMAFLGTQGDVFDAQKDSALAMIGALIAAGITAARNGRRKRSRIV